jgi:hypothetical protein
MARSAGLPPATYADALPISETSYTPSNIQTDAVAYLPAGAADKLRALRERSSERHAATIPFSEIQEASVARQQAETRLKRLLSPPIDDGFNLPADDPRAVSAQKLVEKTTADLRRLNERNASKTAAWHAASQALSACEEWIRSGTAANVTLEDYEGPEPKLAKSENGLIEAIENRRRKVKELHADLSRIRAAPFPSIYAKQQMRSQVAALAQRGAASAADIVKNNGKLVFAHERRSIPVIVGKEAGITAWQEFDALATFCWLHETALVEKLSREIDALANGGVTALSVPDREKQEAKILSDLLAIEREEAFFVWRAQEQNLPVEHRGSCSPIATLRLLLTTTPRAESARGSSIEHAFGVSG